MDMGIKTRRMCASERGRDLDEIRAEEFADLALRKQQELPIVAGNYTRDRIEVTEKPAETATTEETGDENADE
jgi:hypothetical protein